MSALDATMKLAGLEASRLAFALAAAVGLLGVAPINGFAVAADTVLAAYVLWGPSADGSPQAQARIIVPGSASACPELRAGEDRLSMSFRDNPHGFTVKVCEAILPIGETVQISWTGQALPTATLNPARILLLGDTGCKPEDCSEGEPAKPFGDIARAVTQVSPPPQLVIHVGDYNYRGTPDYMDVKGEKLLVYDAGDHSLTPQCQLDDPFVSQNAAYSAISDSWEMWRDDFFEPARELLAAAPFVFARGNHELCSRAGPGWFFFLDASMNQDAAGQLSCPPQGDESPTVGDALSRLVFTPPRILNFAHLRLIVIDSASACDKFAPSKTVEIYRAQLRSVLSKLDDKPTWIVSHRPFWGVKRLCSETGSCPAGSQATTINRTLQTALAEVLSETKLMPASVRLFVSGHMHLFQSLNFVPASDAAVATPPPQIIVGNGGVKAKSELKDGPFAALVEGASVKGLTFTQYGFTMITVLDSEGEWNGQVINPHEHDTIAACQQPIVAGNLCSLSH